MSSWGVGPRSRGVVGDGAGVPDETPAASGGDCGAAERPAALAWERRCGIARERRKGVVRRVRAFLDGCETNGRIEPFKRKLAGEGGVGQGEGAHCGGSRRGILIGSRAKGVGGGAGLGWPVSRQFFGPGWWRLGSMKIDMHILRSMRRLNFSPYGHNHRWHRHCFYSHIRSRHTCNLRVVVRF
jgi:hypothetical protein